MDWKEQSIWAAVATTIAIVLMMNVRACVEGTTKMQAECVRHHEPHECERLVR